MGEYAQSSLLTKMKKASLLALYSKIDRDQGKKRKQHQKEVQKSLNTSEGHLIWRQGPLQRTRSKMRPLAWAWPCPLGWVSFPRQGKGAERLRGKSLKGWGHKGLSRPYSSTSWCSPLNSDLQSLGDTSLPLPKLPSLWNFFTTVPGHV